MEEKERYEFGQRTLFNNREELTTFDGFNLDDFMQIICKLLNQQDKRIKELEQENLSLQEQSIRDNQNWIEETTQLKQQLHDLPKKIVEEIREWIQSQIIYCGGKADEVDILIANASNQVLEDLQNILDTILKKYGGEDESK